MLNPVTPLGTSRAHTLFNPTSLPRLLPLQPKQRMKAVLQRVRHASVSVSGVEISKINRGLLLLIGIGHSDTSHDVEYLAKKILGLKLFPNEDSDDWGWKKSVVEVGGSVLSVSQFTLMGTTKKGTKVDLHGAMPGDQSRILYDSFLDVLRTSYAPDRIQDGQFGAMMDVSLMNDGPVTILLDSSDAPAPVLPKVPTSQEFKEKRKIELAAKAEMRLEMLARKAREKEEVGTRSLSELTLKDENSPSLEHVIKKE